jgi:hypothetical protein
MSKEYYQFLFFTIKLFEKIIKLIIVSIWELDKKS